MKPKVTNTNWTIERKWSEIKSHVTWTLTNQRPRGTAVDNDNPCNNRRSSSSSLVLRSSISSITVICVSVKITNIPSMTMSFNLTPEELTYQPPMECDEKKRCAKQCMCERKVGASRNNYVRSYEEYQVLQICCIHLLIFLIYSKTCLFILLLFSLLVFFFFFFCFIFVLVWFLFGFSLVLVWF